MAHADHCVFAPARQCVSSGSTPKYIPALHEYIIGQSRAVNYTRGRRVRNCRTNTNQSVGRRSM